MNRYVVMLVGVILGGVSLGLGLVSAARAESVTLRYGQIANSARSVSSLALYIAQRNGFLTREGIDLKVTKLPGLHTMVEAVDKNEVDISHTATPFLIQAVLKGSDAVGVVGGPANTVHSLIAKPDIKTFADLKDKVIGLSTPQDTLSIAMRLLLAKHGLKQADYQVLEMQGTPIRLECMMKGACSAAPLTQPDDLVSVQKGFRKLGDSLEVYPVLQFNVIAARRAWAETHKDAVVHFARAFADAYRFMRDPAHREEVAQIMVETMGISAPIARQILVLYFEPDRGVMPKQAEISLPGLTKVIELLGGVGELKAPLPPAERFIDLQYLKAVGAQ
jgi:ABC-type nitrate/sulfonate/bicarbonate transport system substrate-binding protein